MQGEEPSLELGEYVKTDDLYMIVITGTKKKQDAMADLKCVKKYESTHTREREREREMVSHKP